MHTARLNTFRLNTSRLGVVTPGLTILIGGTDRTSSVDLSTLMIERRMDAPTRVSFDAVGLAVTPGQEIVIRDSGSGTGQRSGRVIARTRVITVDQLYTPRGSDRIRDRVTANDWWFLDRFGRVNETWTGTSAGTIVADILATYTDGGYLPGRIIDGTVDMAFTAELVSSALVRIAQAIGAHVLIDPYSKHVSLVASVVDGHAITLDDSDTTYYTFAYGEDLSQVRTRVTIEGASTRLAEAVGTAATTIAVDDVSVFNATGGSARLRGLLLTYTGIDYTAGTLTGVVLSSDGSVGDEITVVVTVDDTAAQTALAAVLGGGASGIVTHYIRDQDLRASEAIARATEELVRFSAVLPAVRYVTRSRFAIPGKVVTVSRTVNRAISTTATIHTVTATTRGHPVEGDLRFDYAVVAGPDVTTMSDVLARTTE